jgi:hypothetical protein
MRHFKAWLAVSLTAAVVIGCGPGKQLPDEVPHGSTERTAGEPKTNVPTTSDPAAKAIVDRAIKAHTQNNPSLLAKGKISKVTAVGTILLPTPTSTDPVPVPSFRTVVARWPDEIKLTHAFKAHIPGTMTLILRGPFTWWGLNNTARPNPDPKGFEEYMRTDGLGQHWLMLMFPLVEPTAVVFDPQKGIGTPPMDSVRLAFPERPVYQLVFDPASGYLMRVEYTHADQAGRAFKEWILSDHKLFDGMMLPTHMKFARTPDHSRTRVIIEDWAVETWEFPTKLDDTVFDPPK